MASDKGPYILLTLYQNLYKDKYGRMPKLNKYREKWAMQDVIDSVEFDRAKELLTYYFRTNKNGHPLNFFYNNFDKIDASLENMEKDIIHRKKLREATKSLVEETE